MINIPENNPRRVPATGKADRERHVKRILGAFAKGQPSVAVGCGANGITEADAKAVGKMFADKKYFASLVYSVEGQFKGLNVSTTQLNACSAAPSATRASGASRPVQAAPADDDDEPFCDTETWTREFEDAGSVEPDIFSFNGELVTLVSDAGKPYAMYRRSYPHKPKWIVAETDSHRVICLCNVRWHAQNTADELNRLAAK